MRTIYFYGSTSQVIVIYMPEHGCLRVLDPARGDQVTYAQQSRFLVEAIPLSDPSNILVNSVATPNLPFLAEQKHTWCYFYAKAELAYQEKNWKQVIEWVEQALALGYRPEDPFEWLAYIEAQARIGNVQSAQELSTTVLAQDKSIRKGLCEAWKRVYAEAPVRSKLESNAQQFLANLECIP